MMQSIKEIYKGKRVFLTGHTGFKGSWLLKILSGLGAEIRGYSLSPLNEINLYDAINGNHLCDSVIADIRDKENLKKSILDFKPDFIFHLAAQPLVRLSYEIPSDTFEINAIGTANLLDAIIELNKKCEVILITTDKVYHNNEWEYPYRENDRLGGYDPYSASKACSELVIDSYRNCFFNPVDYSNHQKSIAVARAGNVIGGGDWSKDRLLPDIVKSLINDKEIVIRNPNSIRPWQHVIEPLMGYLLLGANQFNEPRQYAQAYNFGPNITDCLTVGTMVDSSIKCWGKGIFIIEDQKNKLHEASLLKLDISKSLKELSWKPIFNAEEAIALTINWYKANSEGGDAANLIECDIKEYIKRISNAN